MRILVPVPLPELQAPNRLASQFSVFVDDSGAKHRRARRVGRLLGTGLLAYALVLVGGVVRPLPFPGAGLPPATQEGPVRVDTVPAVPEAAAGEGLLLGYAPVLGFQTTPVAGSGSGTPTTTTPTITTPTATTPAAPDPRPAPAQLTPPAAPATTSPSPAPTGSGQAGVGPAVDRAPRSGTAGAGEPRPDGRGEAPAAAPANDGPQPAPPADPPAAPPAESWTTRGAGR